MVIHSATKYLDGQGRVIAGAVAGSKKLVGDPMTVFLRNAGPTISPFNAWVVLKGLETLELRMLAQSAAALQLAQWLESHPKVSRVHYPGLESHPQHALAKRQQRAGGSVVSFEVKGGREAAWRVIDSTRLVSVTANLGDVKTTIIHPASTTHGRITPEARAAAGITEGLIRVAVGLEALTDLKDDLSRGLEAE
jgi:O-succinylhomoserine sulfhydrylase